MILSALDSELWKLVFCLEEAEQFQKWPVAVRTDWTSTDQYKLDTVRPGDPQSPATFFFRFLKLERFQTNSWFCKETSG